MFFNHVNLIIPYRKPGPLGQVRDVWLCRCRLLLIGVVRKTVPIEDLFSPTTPYAAILFSEHYYDKRYKSEAQNSKS